MLSFVSAAAATVALAMAAPTASAAVAATFLKAAKSFVALPSMPDHLSTPEMTTWTTLGILVSAPGVPFCLEAGCEREHIEHQDVFRQLGELTWQPMVVLREEVQLDEELALLRQRRRERKRQHCRPPYPAR